MTKPNIRVDEDSEGVILYDVTGKYSSSNIYGHGVKNPDVTDYVKATMKAFSPAGAQYSVNMTGDMPRIDDIGYLVRPQQLGGKLNAGVWTFQLILELEDGTTYKSGTYKKLLTREADCCVDALKSKIDYRNLMAGSEREKKIVLLSIALKGAKEAAKCQRFEEAQKIIDIVIQNCKCDACF